jgi:membrane-bound lytic murein transglycosylase B
MASRKVRRRRRTLTLLVLLGLIAWWFVSCSGVSVRSFFQAPSAAPSGPAFAPAIALPPRTAGLTDADLSHNAVATLPDSAWVSATAKATGIPARALAAYAGVALGLSVVKPSCQLSWNTLAGIGWVESHHGTIFGGSIQPNGITVPDIFGIPLDGKNNTQAAPDFDHGDFDGTAEFDRAVGPMQIVPRTWAAWHSDGNNDGEEDGQNIDDTALAAGRYLCYSGGDLSSQAGWQKAIWSYNQVPKYMTDVANKSNEYAKAAGAKS